MSHRMWGITTFFNPSGTSLRLTNYRAFRARSHAQGLPLVAVELAFGSQSFVLREGVDAEVVIQRRSNAVLWQKERLLNIALSALPAECTAVCWIDADVLFEDDNWVSSCLTLLNDADVIQPFSKAIRLPRGATAEAFSASQLDLSIAKGTGDGTYSDAVSAVSGPQASSLSKLRGVSGTTGYAWCARRAVLQEVGFYDRCIVGGADREFAVAALYEPDRVPRGATKIRYRRLRQHIAPWHARLQASMRDGVSFRPGVIHHLWHGDAKDRQYQDRHAILEEHGFDPERDISLDHGGCWQWSTRNVALISAVGAYFDSRNEGE